MSCGLCGSSVSHTFDCTSNEAAASRNKWRLHEELLHEAEEIAEACRAEAERVVGKMVNEKRAPLGEDERLVRKHIAQAMLYARCRTRINASAEVVEEAARMLEQS